MVTTSFEDRPKLAPAVRTVLGSLRRKIRWYVWGEGLTVAATWLGVAFWGSLAIDWFFEPPTAVRGMVLTVVGLVLAGVLVQLVGRRAFVRLSNSSMAMLLERRFPQLDDSLLTAVVLTGRKPDPAECNRQMLDCTCRKAGERIRGVEVRGVFNLVPLRKAVSASVLLAASVAIFAYRSPEAFGTWGRRNLLFSAELWPRNTHLEVEGFEDGLKKVARGAELEVIAKAHTNWPPDVPRGRRPQPIVPQVVQIRYRTEGGRRERRPMSRVGTADPAKDPFQEYSYTFPPVLAPIRFDVVGGDARVRDLRIEVVDNPTVEEMRLRCKFPSYMHPSHPERVERTLPVTGVMQIPRGTEVTVDAKANKDLLGVQIDSTSSERSLPRAMIQAEELADDRRGFRYTIPSLDEDVSLSFTLSDTDGITSREPVRLTLVAIPDGPPQLAVRLRGIGSAITPQARLPVVGEITDDYGIAKVWFQYTVDQQEPTTLPVASPPNHPANLDLDNAGLEVRDLKLGTSQRLVAGQKLLLGLKAEDLHKVGEVGPNVGTSERWLLDVVTPEQLRAILESRELVLRQRFEVIIQEVTETRDLLLKMEFGTPEIDEISDAERANNGVGPGDEPGDEPEQFSPERLLGLRTLRVQRALTNSRKNAHETQGVAEAFDDIRLQLINNRIDTEELNLRLEQGIANPLHRIAEDMFPLLELRLERLREKLHDENLGPDRRDLARQQADAILSEMRHVLDRMIELEDFNEAVELLRTIIKLQEQLGEQTKQRHKQKIRELLEDDG